MSRFGFAEWIEGGTKRQYWPATERGLRVALSNTWSRNQRVGSYVDVGLITLYATGSSVVEPAALNHVEVREGASASGTLIFETPVFALGALDIARTTIIDGTNTPPTGGSIILRDIRLLIAPGAGFQRNKSYTIVFVQDGGLFNTGTIRVV